MLLVHRWYHFWICYESFLEFLNNIDTIQIEQNFAVECLYLNMLKKKKKQKIDDLRMKKLSETFLVIRTKLSFFQLLSGMN